MFALAPTIMGSTDSGGGSRPATYDPLTFTASDKADGNTYFSGSPAALHDGIKTVPHSGGEGAIAINTGEVAWVLTLPSAAYLNRIILYLGQFNGPYNQPGSLDVYGGNSISGPLLSQHAWAEPYMETIELLTDSDYDTARNQYYFQFNGPHGYISVAEIELFGGIVN